MALRALDRKLLRDLRLLWSQVLTIALVVASGVGGFIGCLSAVDSLAQARDSFYAQAHFADVFASVKRAPNALTESLRQTPGVGDVQTTIEQIVRIELPGVDDPVVGQLIGLDTQRPAPMNRVSVRSGRSLDAAVEAGGTGVAGGAIPTLVSAAFADAHGLKPDDRLSALINGKRRTLVVSGTALSPEFIFAGLMGMPDVRGFGVFWVPRDTLAAAYDMAGAFNRVAIKLAPHATQPAVLDALSLRLARYGSREAVGRDNQASHQMLANEIKTMRLLGTLLPAIFLGVAAFLLNVVVSRLVATQREQIAALKALGYANAAIAAHYLKLVLVIVMVGLLLGALIGKVWGVFFTGLYAEFFRFPSFTHQVEPSLWLISLASPWAPRSWAR
jgi:putative ABC transport system permease protein